MPQNALKRTSEEADFDDSEFENKKQKLAQSIRREQQPLTESNIRTRIATPSRRTRGSARIEAEQDESNDDLMLSEPDSPLSSAVSHRFTPPPVTLKSTTGKRAKTKQS